MIRKHVINISSNWGKLLTVKCNHSFYADGVCKDLRFVPTPATENFLKNTRILYKENEDGFTLLYNEGKAQQLLNNKVLRQGKLSFFVINDNPYLINFTDFSLEDFGKIYALSNVALENKEDHVYLHSLPHLDDNKNLKKVLRPKAFGISFPKKVALKDIKIMNDVNEEVTPQNMTYDEQNNTCHLNLSHLPDGSFDLLIKKKKELSFYAVEGVRRQTVFAMLDLYIDEHASNSFPFFDQKSIISRVFEIKMEQRKTFWKYYLVSDDKKNGNGGLTEVKATFNGDAIEFTKPEAVTLPDGKTAYATESKSALALRQLLSSGDKIEMKIKYDKKWLNHTYRLPLPDFKTIKPNRTNGKIYSEIYFYI
ncbi:MAG: hypothetical protein AAFO07_01105 [Bacteroidota bacterium]